MLRVNGSGRGNSGQPILGSPGRRHLYAWWPATPWAPSPPASAPPSSALAALNHIANPNLIYVGQVLHVNGSAAPAAGGPDRRRRRHIDRRRASGGTYRVVAGDTLGSIAARFGTTVVRPGRPQPHRQPQPHLRRASCCG